MTPFELVEPAALGEALALLDPEDPDVRPIAGGTALILMIKSGALVETEFLRSVTAEALPIVPFAQGPAAYQAPQRGAVPSTGGICHAAWRSIRNSKRPKTVRP